MTTREPEWDQESVDWMAALDLYEQMLCPCGCGYQADVSSSPENEGMFVVRDPVRCHVRTALDRARENVGEDTPQPNALMYDAVLREKRSAPTRKPNSEKEHAE